MSLDRHLAINSLFMNVATVLWALTIEPLKDDDGKLIDPDIEGTTNNGAVV